MRFIFLLKFALFVGLFLVINPLPAIAWDDCPYEEVDCTGECGRFIDTDGDGICDHSQPAPEDRFDTDNTETNQTSTTLATTQSTGTENSIVENSDQETITTSESTTSAGKNGNTNQMDYNFLPISIALVVTYLASHLLSKSKFLSLMNHRKFWNTLLLVFFLTSGLSGILLVLRLTYNIGMNLPFNLLFWHVETGLAMSLISIFHILWHWNYFINMLPHKKG